MIADSNKICLLGSSLMILVSHSYKLALKE